MGSFGPSIWIKCKLEFNQVLNSSGGKLHLTQFSATLGLELPSVSSFSSNSSLFVNLWYLFNVWHEELSLNSFWSSSAFNLVSTKKCIPLLRKWMLLERVRATLIFHFKLALNSRDGFILNMKTWKKCIFCPTWQKHVLVRKSKFLHLLILNFLTPKSELLR